MKVWVITKDGKPISYNESERLRNVTSYSSNNERFICGPSQEDCLKGWASCAAVLWVDRPDGVECTEMELREVGK